MRNLVPRFGKRDVTSFMDLTYMDYLLTKKKVNLPRVIIRHMAYVINMPNHELPFGELLTRIFEAFSVPLNYKKGEYPKRLWEKYYDALSDEGPVEAPDVVILAAPEVPVVLTTPAVQQTMKRTPAGVDPSGPSGSMSDFDLVHLQDEFAKAP
ncbi:hypothetical protein Dimus_024629 [Dionaea muscipula]